MTLYWTILALAVSILQLIIVLPMAPAKRIKWTVPIDALPVELLSRIFCWLRDSDGRNGARALNARNPQWAPVLHVCSSWRTIALECKELWAIIPLGHPEWTDLALKLSGPLDIALRIPGGRLSLPRELMAVEERLLAEAFTLARDHLLRVSSLELNMHHRETSNLEDEEGQQLYRHMRALLAPFGDKSMDKLRSLTINCADLTSGSLIGDGWIQNIRHLDLLRCRFSDNIDLLALPLVSLSIHMPDFLGSFVEFLAVLDSCKNLKYLSITETLNRRRHEELFSEGAPPQLSSRRVALPHLRSLSLMTSPLLMSTYLTLFNIPSSAPVNAVWFASDYRVSGAIKSCMATSALEQLDFEPTSDQRISWLAQLCIAFMRHIYLAITASQNHRHFLPSSLSSHPAAEEVDRQVSVTLQSLEWRPTLSIIDVWSGIGTQTTMLSVFGVTTAIREASEWAPIFETMRRCCGYTYTTPAVFVCKAKTEAERLNRLPLTLIALDYVDFTTSYMKTYFPIVKHVLEKSFTASDALFNVNVLFPFGLWLDVEQRADMRRFNVRISDYDAKYTFPEFY